MALTYGFYNSLNHDRVYDALQISEMFDGLITDGVFATIEDALAVKESPNDNTVIVKPGKAWFNHTWTKNDADYPVMAESSSLALDRIDALVLDINSTMASRENKIIFVRGLEADTPERPALVNDVEHHQYPLAYVYRKAEQEHINQADITMMIGTDECPFVVAIMKTISLDELLGQWQDQLDKFVEKEKTDFSEWSSKHRQEFQDWRDSEKELFKDWFETLKVQLDENVAANLALGVENATSKTYELSTKAQNWKLIEGDGYQQSFVVDGIEKETVLDGYIYAKVTNSLSLKDREEISSALGEIGSIRTDDRKITLICFSSPPQIDFNIILTEVK